MGGRYGARTPDTGVLQMALAKARKGESISLRNEL